MPRHRKSDMTSADQKSLERFARNGNARRNPCKSAACVPGFHYITEPTLYFPVPQDVGMIGPIERQKLWA
jgi:hypothetical protein